VERKENKKVYAMKYVNKEACLKQRAVDNIVAEVVLLRTVDHPFVVSLWFTFKV
jgi:serine/threonine kinase 32